MMAASYFFCVMYESPLATYFRLSVSGFCLHDAASAARIRMPLRKDRAVRSIVMDVSFLDVLVAEAGYPNLVPYALPAGEGAEALGISRAALAPAPAGRQSKRNG